jgi:hypothetical protein
MRERYGGFTVKHFHEQLRWLADPPIAQALRPLIAQPVAPAPEGPLRDPSISAASP